MRQPTVRWALLAVAVVLAGAWLAPPVRADDNADKAADNSADKASDNSSDSAQPAAAKEGEADKAGEANNAGDRPGDRGERRGRRDPKQMLERMRTAINELTPAPTDEQKKKLDEAFAKASSEFDKVAAETEDADPQARREKFQPIFQALRQDVESTLNEEQKKALAERVQRFGPGGEGGPGGGFGRGQFVERYQEALKKIGVSDEQQKQIDPILADVKTKVDAARQKAESGGGREAWEEVRPAMREAREKINAILTPEQQEKLRQEMPRGGRGGGGGRGGEGRRGPDSL